MRAGRAIPGIGLVILLTLFGAGCESTSREGSGSPFQSGSARGSVEGSDDFDVSQVIRDRSGAIQGILTYTGTCHLVKAELRFSYEKDGQVLSGQDVDGIDHPFNIGPLAPNQPYHHTYPGENTFTPDGIVFVIAKERCA